MTGNGLYHLFMSWGIGEFILILWFAVVGDDRHHILFILVVYTNPIALQ